MIKKPKSKKLGGRPKKSDKERRDRLITAAFTKKEEKKVIEDAEKANVSRSSYLRQKAITGRVVAVDVNLGVLVATVEKALSQLKYCRSHFHRIEREIQSRHNYTQNPAPLSDSDIRNMKREIEVSLVTINMVLRKVFGLDPS